MEAIIGLAIIVFVYAVLLVASAFHWRKQKEISFNVDASISIIIAFRNEEKYLKALIQSLKQLTYKNVEIILVNDHSDDDSCQIINDNQFESLNLVHLPGSLTGKKSAITYGIENSKSDYILITDADCVVPTSWVEVMLQELIDNKRDWQAGPIKYEYGKGFFNFFQRLESVYLVMISGFTMNINKPTTCNGANIIFKKSVFLEAEGYQGLMQTPSGDDEMLMQKLSAKGYQLGYCTNKDAVIETAAATSLKELIGQRIRWASKLKHGKSKNNLILALFIMSVHISIVASLFIDIRIGVDILLLRLGAECIAAVIMFLLFGMRFNLFYFLISFFVYPLYAIFMSFISQGKRFTWKGRVY